MASKLEEETKTYEVPILITGAIYDEFTDYTKNQCRQIDNIIFKGHSEPTALFTCDIESDHLGIEAVKEKQTMKQQRTARVKARI